MRLIAVVPLPVTMADGPERYVLGFDADGDAYLGTWTPGTAKPWDPSSDTVYPTVRDSSFRWDEQPLPQDPQRG